ncbi:MAG: hypothetical protein EOO69_13585 [Moraxellaceae bacterium]|nr:MAG: hypothetical protein EOO69_13585 [Moraxellaceae bacterium]
MNDERIDYAGIGITKEQLVRVNQIMNQRRIVKLQDRLRIFKNEEFYCFDGAGRLAYLNSVRVRADGSFARINDIKMYPDSSSFRKPADSSYLYPRLRFTSYGHNQMLDMLYDGKLHEVTIIFFGCFINDDCRRPRAAFFYAGAIIIYEAQACPAGPAPLYKGQLRFAEDCSCFHTMKHLGSLRYLLQHCLQQQMTACRWRTLLHIDCCASLLSYSK